MSAARASGIVPALLVPHYDHSDALVACLPTLLDTGYPLIVVDDGSAPEERDRLEAAMATHAAGGALLHYAALPINCGKGAAVMHGCALARERGYSHVLQVDADGQHDLADVPALLALARAEPDAIVSGRPTFDRDAPRIRVHGRKLTTLMIAIETLGGGIEDGLCGYRVYPLESLERMQARFAIAPRMGFDTDVLVKARWLGVPVRFLPTRVRYPLDGRSHFHYLRDNLDLLRLHLTLLLGAVRRLPTVLARRRAL